MKCDHYKTIVRLVQRKFKIKSMSIKNIIYQLQILLKMAKLVQFFFKQVCFKNTKLINILNFAKW